MSVTNNPEPNHRQVFAPADFAFESIGITNETVLTFDVDILTTVLSYHVITNEAVDNSTLRGSLREFDTMLQGNTLRNSVSGGVLDDTGVEATVLAADLQAVNGLVHVIDVVLEPYPMFTQSPTAAPTAAPTLLDLVRMLEIENTDPANPYFGMFDTMIEALSASGLDLELAQPGPFTVRWAEVFLLFRSFFFGRDFRAKCAAWCIGFHQRKRVDLDFGEGGVLA